MKKLMMVAAMVALVLVAAVPAIAQVQHAIQQEDQSGDVNANFTALDLPGLPDLVCCRRT